MKFFLQDLNEIPENIEKLMTFLPVSSLEEVIQAAFPGGFPFILNQQTFTELSKLQYINARNQLGINRDH